MCVLVTSNSESREERHSSLFAVIILCFILVLGKLNRRNIQNLLYLIFFSILFIHLLYFFFLFAEGVVSDTKFRDGRIIYNRLADYSVHYFGVWKLNTRSKIFNICKLFLFFLFLVEGLASNREPREKG